MNWDFFGYVYVPRITIKISLKIKYWLFVGYPLYSQRKITDWFSFVFDVLTHQKACQWKMYVSGNRPRGFPTRGGNCLRLRQPEKFGGTTLITLLYYYLLLAINVLTWAVDKNKNICVCVLSKRCVIWFVIIFQMSTYTQPTFFIYL